jgi:hypothetical protein
MFGVRFGTDEWAATHTGVFVGFDAELSVAVSERDGVAVNE